MALRYDFDMVAITPEGLPDEFGDLTVTGVAAEKVAMFRDAQTANALKTADAAVRTYFTDSGFALSHFDSGAPTGRFAMRDEDARIAVIDRLTANLETHDLTNAAWGTFDFDAFMDALDAATPVEDELLAPTKKPTPEHDRAVAEARIASRKDKGRRMMALGGSLLGLIMIFYVASQTLN